MASIYTPLALFVSTYLLVLALGGQSLLVNHGYFKGAFFNSFAIGLGNLVLLKLVPDAGPIDVAGYLLGGPFGIVSAMILFKRYHRSPAEKQTADDLALAAHVLERVQKHRGEA